MTHPPARPGANRRVLVVAVGAAVLAISGIWWGTRPLGPGLYGDGASYLSAAVSLVHSGRLRVIGAPYWSSDSTMVMAQWPPGFAMAIAAALRVGLAPMAAVTAVQVVAAAVTMVLTVVTVGRVSSALWGGVAGLAVLLTPALLGTQLNVVSEPLYVAGVSGLLCLMTARPGRPLAMGVVGAGLVMVRYLGLAAVAAAGMWVAMEPGRPAQRLRRGGVAALPGLCAYAGWRALVRRNGGVMFGTVVDRHIEPIARSFVGAAAAWLAPEIEGVPWAHRAAKLLIVLLAVCTAWSVWRAAVGDGRGATLRTVRGGMAAPGSRLIAAAGVLVGCHLALLLLARVSTSSVEFTLRTYAPVHYLLTVMGVVTLARVWPVSVPARWLGTGAAVVWLAVGAVATSQLLHRSRTEGIDHASAAERSSPTLAWLRAHSTNAPIYTNEPAKIYFHLHRAARILPWIVAGDTLAHVDAVLHRRPGYVVWFDGGRAEGYVPTPLLPLALSPSRLVAGVRLVTAARLADGIVFVPDTVTRSADATRSAEACCR